MEERENQSSLYITPEDRIEKVEVTSESNVTEEVIKDTIHLESGKKDENRIEENKNIRRVLLFFFLVPRLGTLQNIFYQRLGIFNIR